MYLPKSTRIMGSPSFAAGFRNAMWPAHPTLLSVQSECSTMMSAGLLAVGFVPSRKVNPSCSACVRKRLQMFLPRNSTKICPSRDRSFLIGRIMGASFISIPIKKAKKRTHRKMDAKNTHRSSFSTLPRWQVAVRSWSLSLAHSL